MIRKQKLSYKLLKYHLPGFDYTKVNNSAYIKRNYNKLMINYLFRNYNIELALKYLIKSNSQFFKTINSMTHLIASIENEYNLVYSDKVDRDRLKINKKTPTTCLVCNKRIHYKKTFCSNTCSNKHRANDPYYIKHLSNSAIKAHANTSHNAKVKRNKKISKTLNEYNKRLSYSEKSNKYSNNKPRLTAYNNLSDRFTDIKLNFTKEYYYNNTYLPVTCNKCGNIWNMTKSTTMAKTQCRNCIPFKKHKTQSEIFNYIKNSIPNVVSDENKRNIISNELDIYIKDLNFAVEYNGLLPHSFGKSKVSYYNNYNIDMFYHLRKTEECEALGLQLYHIFENEYNTKKDIWLSVLNSKMNITNSVFARKCIINEITDTGIVREFLDNNHLQGKCNSSVKLGLYYQDELVSLMTFRKHKKYNWEIARFCSKLNTTVVGGASKLLRYFERMYNPKSIISYANRRWSTGNLYKKLGFTFVKNTSPNYFYFRENENILYAREQFQKHKLRDKLESFNPELTETENMLNNGYRIIYDSGNKQYIKYYQD